MRPLHCALLVCALAAMVSHAQEPIRSFSFTSMDLDAGEFAFNFETQQIDRLSRGADVTLYPDTPGQPPLRLRAREITFQWSGSDAEQPTRVVLEGNVVINHPQGEIQSARAEWNVATSRMVFTGSPRLVSDRSGTLTARVMELNLADGDFRGEDIRGENVPIRGGGGAPTQQPNLLTIDSVSDWTALLREIRAEADEPGPNPSNHILGMMDANTRAGFRSLADADALVDGQKRLLVDALNRLLTSPRLYDPAAWEGREVPENIAAMIAGGTLTASEQVMVNRAALHAAYPSHIGPPTASGTS